MVFTRSLSWLSRRPVVPRKAGMNVRPTLEPLEDRVVPNATAFPTTAAVTGVSTTYNFTQQIDKVSVQVSSTNSIAGAPQGQVTVIDNGQAQNVTLSPSGTATATFTFNLFANPPHGAHTVQASYDGGEDEHGNVLQGSFSPSFLANSTNNLYLDQIYIDAVLLLALANQA